MEGYEVPLHRALTEPILIAGAPRGLAIAIGTLAAAIGIGLQLWAGGLLIWIIGHGLAVMAARADPDFAKVFAKCLRAREQFQC